MTSWEVTMISSSLLWEQPWAWMCAGQMHYRSMCLHQTSHLHSPLAHPHLCVWPIPPLQLHPALRPPVFIIPLLPPCPLTPQGGHASARGRMSCCHMLGSPRQPPKRPPKNATLRPWRKWRNPRRDSRGCLRRWWRRCKIIIFILMLMYVGMGWIVYMPL